MFACTIADIIEKYVQLHVFASIHIYLSVCTFSRMFTVECPPVPAVYR